MNPTAINEIKRIVGGTLTISDSGVYHPCWSFTLPNNCTAVVVCTAVAVCTSGTHAGSSTTSAYSTRFKNVGGTGGYSFYTSSNTYDGSGSGGSEWYIVAPTTLPNNAVSCAGSYQGSTSSSFNDVWNVNWIAEIFGGKF